MSLAPEYPWCFKCQEPMRSCGSRWRCSKNRNHTVKKNLIAEVKILAIKNRKQPVKIGEAYCWVCKTPMYKKDGRYFCKDHWSAKAHEIAANRSRKGKKHRDRIILASCWIHRTEMHKHGKNLTCDGHWATKIHAVYSKPERVKKNPRTQTFAQRSANITGKVKQPELVRQSYPYCLRCRIRMARRSNNAGNGKGFKCSNCGCSVMHIYISRSGWRTRIPTALRTDYERLLRGIAAKVPYGLPEEMRDDIKSAIAIDALEAIRLITSDQNVQMKIREFKRLNPQYVEITDLEDTLVG